MRKQLAENIVLLGGTVMTKGFKARLKEELLSLIKQPKYSDKLFINVFKFHNPPAKENYVAWLGGIFRKYFTITNPLLQINFKK